MFNNQRESISIPDSNRPHPEQSPEESTSQHRLNPSSKLWGINQFNTRNKHKVIFSWIGQFKGSSMRWLRRRGLIGSRKLTRMTLSCSISIIKFSRFFKYLWNLLCRLFWIKFWRLVAWNYTSRVKCRQNRSRKSNTRRGDIPSLQRLKNWRPMKIDWEKNMKEGSFNTENLNNKKFTPRKRSSAAFSPSNTLKIFNRTRRWSYSTKAFSVIRLILKSFSNLCHGFMRKSSNNLTNNPGTDSL